MTRINKTAACIAGFLAMGISHAAADVFDFQVAKLHIYNQTAPAAPTSPSSFVMNPFIDTLPGDAGSATINGIALNSDISGEWESWNEFPSQSALDAAFPGFVFNLHLQGGTLGVRDESVILTSPAVYPSPAALTPASFNQTQDADSNLDLLIEWSPADASTSDVFLFVSTATGTHIKLIEVMLPPEQTSFLIPAALLDPDTQYDIELAFANAEIFQGQPNPGFGIAADGLSGYASITLATFTTAPPAPGVADFWFTKARDYQQTTQSPPTTPFEYVVDTVINMAPGDATSATINGNPMTEDFPGEWGIFIGYPDQASLDAAYPSAVPYTMALSGGTLGSVSEIIPLLPEHYPDAPALTPASFDQVQNIDTTQDFLVDWIDPGPGTDFVIFAIYDPNNDTCVLDMFFTFGKGEFLIPAGTMSPDTEYAIEIGSIHGTAFTGTPTSGGPVPGFGTQAQGLAGYESITSINITTASLGCTDVGTAGLIKEITYVQGADNTQPTSPTLYRFDGFIDTFGGGFLSGHVFNGITTVDFLEDEPGAWELDDTSVEFASKAALDAAFPNTLYNLHIQDGTLGIRDQVVIFSPVDDYPAVPFLIGTSFSDLDGMDPTQELTINWAPVSPNTTNVFFEIFNIGTDTKAFDVQLSPGTTSIIIPADALMPGQMYELDINLLAADAFADDCPGFGLGSTNFAGFISSTSVFFTPQTPQSCPADLTGEGDLNFLDVSAFLSAFGSGNPVADFNGDGNFNFLDVSAFLGAFGAGCP